jgi:probable F420-dependent oxidoreductase
VVTLSFLAACTETINLGTGIVILPQRQPLVLAKQLASLDTLASGRLYFGLAVGYLRPEMEAIGVPYDERGARAEEYLAAMQAIWTEEKPDFQGEFISFSGVQAYPKRRINIVMGGHSMAAFKRSIKMAGGWYGFGYSPESAAEALRQIRQLRQAVPRPAALGELEISITPTPRIPVTPAMVEQFSNLGVHRLIIAPPRKLDLAGLEKFVIQTAKDLIKS